MIRISEADYGAAMSEHQKYIREAERLGPIWSELRIRQAQSECRQASADAHLHFGAGQRSRFIPFDSPPHPAGRRSAIGLLIRNLHATSANQTGEAIASPD